MAPRHRQLVLRLVFSSGLTVNCNKRWALLTDWPPGLQLFDARRPLPLHATFLVIAVRVTNFARESFRRVRQWSSNATLLSRVLIEFIDGREMSRYQNTSDPRPNNSRKQPQLPRVSMRGVGDLGNNDNVIFSP